MSRKWRVINSLKWLFNFRSCDCEFYTGKTWVKCKNCGGLTT